MEKESEVYVLRVVPNATFKVLLRSGRYQLRSPGCAMGKLPLPDGRDDILVAKETFDHWQRLQREIEAQEVSDASVQAEIDRLIAAEIAASPAPAASIPSEDLAAATRLGVDGGPLPEHGESSRPRDRLGRTIDFGPLF